MDRKPRNEPAVRRRAALQLWLANLVIGVVIGANWLAHMPAGVEPGGDGALLGDGSFASAKLWLFALPALVSTVLTLTLVPGLVFVWLAHALRSTRALGTAQAVFWTVFHVLLFADTRIFNIFRYHMNGQVLNLVYTRGSEDAIHLGWQVWTAVAVGLSGVGALQVFLWGRALRRANLEWSLSVPRARLLSPAMIFGAVILPSVVIEKTIYAASDLESDRQVTALARLFPLYARVPMKDFASAVLGDEVVPVPPRVAVEGFELDYPRTFPSIDPHGPRPNVVVVVIDCLRRDMVAPETTPEIDRWASGARRFENHLSGGNSTRYGIFSLLYGLHGSYWFSFLQEGRSPVLVDALLEEGYELGVFSSASQNYPELRATAWARIPHAVHDEFGALPAWRRDELSAEAFTAWLSERETDDAPFFGFLLLDSPHQTYSHPPDAKPFTPSSDEVDYMAMTRNEGPEPAELERVRNRYKNAVHHADAVAGRVLAFADAHLGDDTLVVVTGDHGEEFRECGFFGHTSAYTEEQVAVPFLMKGAGVEPGVERGPTSHLDFAPTLLELLGAHPDDREGWTLGESLFDPPPDRRRVISGWNELGVWTPNGILRVPLSLLEFDVEVYDYRWRLQVDDRAALEAEAPTLVQLGAECSRFLK